MSPAHVLAPQMLQSLALLQAQRPDLKALVEQELQQNPVLEEVPATEVEQQEKNTEEGNEQIDQTDPTEPPEDVNFDPATEKANDEPVDDFQAEFEKLVQ